jgi:hypothetical protein
MTTLIPKYTKVTTANRTIADKFGETVSVKDYGAVGDGSTNDATAIQAALNSGATYITVPTGSYLINAVLTMTAGQKLVGERSTIVIGNTLCGAGTENNTPIITMANNTTVQGLLFRTQTQVVINATTTAPVVHPWIINGDGCSYFQIRDIEFLACWRGIRAGVSAPCETMFIDTVEGICYNTGIYIDQCTDTSRINNLHLNPNYATYNGGAGNFTNEDQIAYIRNTAQGNAIHVFRADWLQISNSFAYGYYRGLYLQVGTSTVAGAATVSMVNSGLDGCKYCIVSTQVINLAVSNTTLASTQLIVAETNKCVEIIGSGNFQFDNCFFIGQVYDAGIDFSGSGALSISNSQITDHVFGIIADEGVLNIDTVMFGQAAGTTADIALSGTVKANIRNARRTDGTASVTTGLTATTCPTTFENAEINISYLPFVAEVGVASTGIAPTLIANGATTYFATLPAQDGNYLVYAGQDAGSNGTYRALAYVRAGTSACTVSVLATNGITIAVSGLQVGVTNSAGADLNVDFGYLRLYQA